MKLRKYPPVCLILAALILLAILGILWFVLSSHTSDMDTKEAKGVYQHLVPFLPGVIQTAGLVLTVILAFLPIQSLAFHQAKKVLLEEILRLLTEYEKAMNEVCDLMHAHQKGEWGDETPQISRAKITFEQKKAQALLARAQKYLPQTDAEKLASAAAVWWKELIGEDAYVMKKTDALKITNPTLVNMLEAQFKLQTELHDMRQRCIFDIVCYWDLSGKKQFFCLR